MSRPQPNSWVLDLPEYVPGASHLQGVATPVKLSSNEGAFGPAPAALAAMKDAVGKVHRYPDASAAGLRAAIAQVHGIEAERILVGAGSDELLCLVCRAYLAPGTEAVQSRHGFLMYDLYTRSVGARTAFAPETAYCADVDALLSAVTDKTRVVFVANPNNPTGTMLDNDALWALRRGLRDDIVLVIDAAYAEYVTDPAYDGGIEIARETANTLMTRTFSKIYGLGGLRLGWCYGSPELIGALGRLRSPFNVSSLALAAGEAAMKDQAFITMSRDHNAKWQAEAAKRLDALGLARGGDQVNFMTVFFPEDSTPGVVAANAAFDARGIIVRRVAAYGLPDALRITIGTDEQMEAVFNILSHLMTSRKAS